MRDHVDGKIDLTGRDIKDLQRYERDAHRDMGISFFERSESK